MNVSASLAASSPGTETVVLGWDSIGYASILIVVNVVLSFLLNLKISSQLFVSSLRCVVQLSVLGLILQPVFDSETWWSVLLWSIATILLAAREAYARPKYTYPYMFPSIFLSMLIAVPMTLSVGIFAILKITPWWEARYVIPLLGMLLGNCLNGLSLGLDKASAAYSEERKKIEIALAAGSTKWEAGRPIVVDAMRTGLMPTLQSMSVIGLVSIPGMMTGQILGGNSPSQASKYQIIIMFIISATTGIALIIAQLFLFWIAFDSNHCLRADRFEKRGKLDDIIISFFKLIWRFIQKCFS